MIINSFTVFLFQQKEVFSQTEEEQTLSSSDDNIVKVFFKFCDTWHVLVQKENMLLFKRMIIILFTVFLFQKKEVSSQTEEEQTLSTSDDNIVKVFYNMWRTWHVLLQLENVLVVERMVIISFIVFLFQQKEVSSQTEEERILSTSTDNIVKVIF